MIINTHLLISQIIYKYISNKMDLKLDRISFAYGNIEPDLNKKDINHSHTLEKSFDSVCEYSEELMNENIPIKEFSRRLGVICHFGCDYFCLYHRDGNEKKSLHEHIFYEVILHFKLLILFFSGRIKLNYYEMNEDSIEAIVMRIQKKYNSEDESLTRDITNSIFAVSQISKLLVHSSQLYLQKNAINMKMNIQNLN